MKNKISNFTEVNDYEITKWFKANGLELSSEQWRKFNNLLEYDYPFYTYKRSQKTSSVLMRLTIIFLPIVFIILFLYLPIQFLFTGRWGYNGNQIKWYQDWCDKLGL